MPVQSRHPCQHHSRKLLGQRVTRGIESTGRKGTQFETVVKIECLFGVLCPDRRCCHVESVSGGKAARSAWMLAFGYAVSRAEAGARVRSRSRHARVGRWCRCARPVRVCVAGKWHGGLPREPNDWLRTERRARSAARRVFEKQGGAGQERPVWSAMELNVDCPTARIVFRSSPNNQSTLRPHHFDSNFSFTPTSPHLLHRHRSIGQSSNRHG